MKTVSRSRGAQGFDEAIDALSLPNLVMNECGVTEEEKNGPNSNKRMEMFCQLEETSNGATPLNTELHIPATACMNGRYV